MFWRKRSQQRQWPWWLWWPWWPGWPWPWWLLGQKFQDFFKCPVLLKWSNLARKSIKNLTKKLTSLTLVTLMALKALVTLALVTTTNFFSGGPDRPEWGIQTISAEDVIKTCSQKGQQSFWFWEIKMSENWQSDLFFGEKSSENQKSYVLGSDPFDEVYKGVQLSLVGYFAPFRR